MNNIKNIEGKCSGCGACSAICPKNAIEYYLNEDGFYTVDIIKEKCINCGLCTKVCLKNIKNNNKINEIKTGKLISARTKNEEILNKCTSGAIAYEIGLYGLENNYKIVGVIYDEKENIARTIIANNKEEFEKMKSSKYIQSKSDEAIKKVIELAKKNPKDKFIIFGTPCQIYGYKMAIEQLKIKNEIIYIDLFCHGVPSYLIWNNYLDEIKNRKKIKQVNFRDKKYGWHNFVIKIEKDKVEYKKAERSNFYKMFFDNVLLNESCSTCEVRKQKSHADIRLGDFWGKKYSLDIKGVSAVVILTKRGKEIIDNIKSRIDIIDDNESIEECLKYQSTKDYIENYDRHELIENIKAGKSLKNIIKKYRKRFPFKKVLKLRVKALISYLPASVKIKIASKVK